MYSVGINAEIVSRYRVIVIYQTCVVVCCFRYEYHWCDGANYKKPTRLPAPTYIELLMEWIEQQINNEDLFPVTVGQ